MENLFQVMCLFGSLFFILFGVCAENSIEANENPIVKKIFLVLMVLCLLCAVIGFGGIIYFNL